MDDWCNRELKTAEGQLCSVIKVIRHKTAVHGAARIVLTNADVSKVDRHVRSIRPHLISDDDTEHLLCLLGGRQLNRFSQRFAKLAEIYGFEQLTATRVRKITATEATLNLTGPDKALVTKQVAHTLATEQQYYEALTGTQHAATAVAAMAKSRRERGNLEGPTGSAAPSATNTVTRSSREVSQPGPSGLQHDKPEESLPSLTWYTECTNTFWSLTKHQPGYRTTQFAMRFGNKAMQTI